MDKFAPYAKAIVGALVGALAALSQALDDGGVSAQEWVGVAIALLGGLGIVFAVPNRDPQALHQEESVQPPQAGLATTDLCLIVIAAGVVVFVLFGANLVSR